MNATTDAPIGANQLARISCPSCGLVMSNGFCLHGNVDEVRAAHEKNIKLKQREALDRASPRLRRLRLAASPAVDDR